MITKKLKLSDEDRLRAVIKVLTGSSEEEVASSYGVTIKTLHVWTSKFAPTTQRVHVSSLQATKEKATDQNDPLTFWTLIIPIIIWFVYIIGYLRISYILRNYHVAPIYIFDPQYFAGGFVIFIPLLVIYIIIRSVWLPNTINFSPGFKEHLHKLHPPILIALFITTVIGFWLFPQSFSSKQNLAAISFLTVYSLFCLGTFVYYVRLFITDSQTDFQVFRKIWANYLSQKSPIARLNMLYQTTFIPIFTFLISLLSIILISYTSREIIKNIPQFFGGQEAIKVELILDVEKLTDDIKNDLVLDKSGRTKQLCLINRSQNSYIVTDSCDADYKKLWVLTSDVVLGEISENKIPK